MAFDSPAGADPLAARCPLCGGDAFVDFRGREAERCQSCGAHARTRSTWLLLTEVCRVDSESRVLHFAPEPALAPRLRAICGANYWPHDLANSRYRFGFPVRPCDLCKDIERLFMPGSFDVVIHNHVLEHLPCNYTIVLQRLHALLRPGGHHIFSFPIGQSGSYGSDLSPELSEAERAVRFGQKDHIRRFTREDFDRTVGMVFDIDHSYSMADFIPEAKLRAAAIPPSRWTLELGPVFIVEKKEAAMPDAAPTPAEPAAAKKKRRKKPRPLNLGMYETGAYWRRRSDMLYYQYFRYIMRCIAADARSMIDVGSGNSPYLEWFDWIPDRLSVDINTPYSSATVRAIQGDIRTLPLETADICTCMQVLEHIPDPEPFARRLLELGRVLLVSVPHKWPKGSNADHPNDPVSLASLDAWFGRAPNYHLVVQEPFTVRKGARLFAIYDIGNPDRTFGSEVRKGRRQLE